MSMRLDTTGFVIEKPKRRCRDWTGFSTILVRSFRAEVQNPHFPCPAANLSTFSSAIDRRLLRENRKPQFS
jgi:hypothetical protein